MAEPAPLPDTLSLREFAAHMRVKPGYVTELRKTGRLVMTADGRVRVAESLALIADTRDPAKDGVRARHAAARGTAAPVPPATSEDEDGDDGGGDEGDAPASNPEPDSPFARRRAKAQAEREEALARKALRDEQVELGELLPRDEVIPAVAAAATTFRTSLENLAATLAPQMAALDDEARCKVLLDTSFEHALGDLSRKFAAIGREG